MPAVNLITTIPNFVSPEEHKNIIASTPSSFNDIPPVLRHREENVFVKLDPAIDGFTEQDGAQGTLYVITSVLAFMSTTGRGFQIEYPAITLHAVSRGEQGPSIYCQLDDAAEVNGAAAPTTDEDEDTELRELSIFPQNPASLDPIFECLSICAALHPDPDTGSDENDGIDDAFIDSSNFETFTGDQEQELSEVGRAALAYFESIIEDPHDLTTRFEDAEDDEGAEVPPDSESEESFVPESEDKEAVKVTAQTE